MIPIEKKKVSSSCIRKKTRGREKRKRCIARSVQKRGKKGGEKLVEFRKAKERREKDNGESVRDGRLVDSFAKVCVHIRLVHRK